MQFDPSRVLSGTSPREQYVPSKQASLNDVVMKSLHFGQRKLHLSEVEFFCAVMETESFKTANKPILVVYVGAAGGMHLPFLFDMFPDIKFVLIDPARYCEAVQDIAKKPDSPILELISDYCSDEMCLRLARSYEKEYTMLLVSDIRSGTPARMRMNMEHTETMFRDNELQRGYCWALRAFAAMLKFHPPYPAVTDKESKSYDPNDTTPESIEYFAGSPLWGVWAPKSSSEMRLVVEGPFLQGSSIPSATYECRKHEEQCYYYNTHDRYHKDCKAEEMILQRYLDLFPQSRFSTVESLSNELSRQLGYPLFQPLAAGFTEDTARWAFLMQSAKKPGCLEWYEKLKHVMTIDAVKELVTKYKDSQDIPHAAVVGSETLPDDFWRVFCCGDFSEAYSFPWVHWGFYRKAVPAPEVSTARNTQHQDVGHKRPRERR